MPRFEVEAVRVAIVDCLRCGTGRFDPMPSHDELRSFYPRQYYGGARSPEAAASTAKFHRGIEWLVRLIAARHVAFLGRELPPGARVLDVGCGRGVVLNPLAERGFEVAGVEITSEAAVGLDPRVELRVAERLAEAAFPEAHFDQIIVWHVLEHLADPFEMLTECHRLLRPGGRLIVAVPNYSSLQARWSGWGWFHLDPPRHLHHFSLDGLRRIASRSGFRVRSEHHFSLRQNPFGWIQSAINRCARRPNRLYEFLQGMGRAPSLAERVWHWSVLIVAAAPALALAVLASWLRSGATVHVVADREDIAGDG